MDIRLVYGNIAEMHVDGIVNASNGVGYMGGQRCIDALYPGVAESIQYASQGLVEEEAKANCKENNRFNCYAPGNVFITDAPGLLSKYVLHAVTMRFPGSKAKATTIDKLIPLIFEEVNKLNLNSIAIPLLGTGTGRLDKMYVYHKIISYDNILSNTKNCNATVYIVCPNKKFFNSINKESYPVNFINLVNDLHNECKDKLLQINPTITNLFQSFVPELERQLLKPNVYNELKKVPLNIKDFCRIVYTKSSAYSVMSYIANTDFDFSSFAYVSYCAINSDFLSCVDYHFYSRVDNRSFSVIYNFEDSNCSFCYNDKGFKLVTINDINIAIQNNTHSELFKLKYKK